MQNYGINSISLTIIIKIYNLFYICIVIDQNSLSIMFLTDSCVNICHINNEILNTFKHCRALNLYTDAAWFYIVSFRFR